MNYILHQAHFKKLGKIQHQINSNVYQGSDYPYDPGGTMIC